MADSIADAYVRIRPKADGFKADTQRLLGGISFGGALKGAAGATVGILGVSSAIDALRSSVQAVVMGGAAFETELNTFQAVTGATTRQLELARASAKALGRDIALPGVSASDAAVAMTELAKGGLTVQDSLDGVRGSLELATAANTGFGDAAQVIARNLSAFELSGDQASRVADLLAGASIAATGEVSDMAIALQQSAAVAHNAGISIDDTVTAIAQLAKAGLVGSDAGTSLRTMILRLIPSTSKAAEEMAKLGVKVLDQNRNMLPLPRILENYRKALQGMSGAQRQAALNTIFGQDAIRSASILSRAGSAAFADTAAVVTKLGQAQVLTEARTKGLAGSLGALQSNLETIAISISERVNPVIKTVVDSTNEGLDWLTANWPRFEQAVRPTVDRVVAAVKTNWPQIRDTIVEVSNSVIASVESFVDIVTTLWNRFGSTIIEVARLSFNRVIGNLRAGFRIIQDALKTFSSLLHGDWGDAWGALKDLAVTALRQTWANIKTTLKIFRSVGTTMVDFIRDGFNAGVDALQETALRAVAKVLSLIAKIPTKFEIFGKTIGIENPAQRALESIEGTLQGIRDSKAARQIADAIADNTAKALDARTRDVTTAVETVTKKAVKSVEKVKPEAVATGRTIGKAVGDGITAEISTAGLNAIESLQKRLRDAIENGNQQIRDAVLGAQRNLATLGTGLTSQLDRIIDEGPLGVTLRRMQEQLAGRQTRTQAEALQKAIRDAQKSLTAARGSIATNGSLTAAQQREVATFLAPKRQALQEAKRAWGDFQTQAVIGGIQQRQTEQKAAINKRVSELVDQFNRGAISGERFQQGIGRILEGQSKAFRIAGRTLGTAFSNGFNSQIQGLLLQAQEIQKGRNRGLPSLGGRASIPDVVSPVTVMSDQLKTQREILTELRKTRLQQQQAANKRAEKERARAAKKKAGPVNYDALAVGATD